MLNSSERNQDTLEDEKNSSAHNQNDERVVDSIAIDDSNLSTLEVEDIDSSSVELDNVELSDVEVNEVKLNDVKISSVETNDVGLVEIEPINAELSNAEPSDIKLNDDKPIDAEVNNVASTEGASVDVEPSAVELSDIASNTAESNDADLDNVESNDVESKSIKLDSTKLASVEIVADDEAPVAVSSTEHLATNKAMDRMPAHVTTGSSLTPKGRLPKTPVMIANGSRAFVWYALALVVLVIDQWTKWLAETNLSFNEPVPVIEPFLNWTLAYNYGAAFSFLADAGGWQKWFFSGLALVMAIFLTVYLTRAPRQAKLLSFGLALVLGGAVGNLIDRLLHGHVIDFIHVHYANAWHYPIFNIADMGISIGVAIIIIDMIFLENKRDS